MLYLEVITCKVSVCLYSHRQLSLSVQKQSRDCECSTLPCVLHYPSITYTSTVHVYVNVHLYMYICLLYKSLLILTSFVSRKHVQAAIEVWLADTVFPLRNCHIFKGPNLLLLHTCRYKDYLHVFLSGISPQENVFGLLTTI